MAGEKALAHWNHVGGELTTAVEREGALEPVESRRYCLIVTSRSVVDDQPNTPALGDVEAQLLGGIW